MRLRHLGVYALPDGKEYVADAFTNGGVALVPYSVWRYKPLAAFSVSPEGLLLADGAPAGWSVEQLTDVGREESYPSADRLL